jgi:soluble lytic murein transglycosylase-like protein
VARAGVKLRRLLPAWAWVALALGTPLALLNLAVAFFGHSRVFPLSPYFLEEKAYALGAYARHRPLCLLTGHPPPRGLIDAAERRHGLPRGLLHALVEVESDGRAHRISPAGAMGLGQLMPGTARQLGVDDPFEPAPALDGSARYLSQLLRRTGSVRLAVAAYNAGPGSVVGGQVPRNGETEYYVPRVLGAWGRWRAAHRAPAERATR